MKNDQVSPLLQMNSNAKKVIQRLAKIYFCENICVSISTYIGIFCKSCQSLSQLSFEVYLKYNIFKVQTCHFSLFQTHWIINFTLDISIDYHKITKNLVPHITSKKLLYTESKSQNQLFDYCEKHRQTKNVFRGMNHKKTCLLIKIKFDLFFKLLWTFCRAELPEFNWITEL